MLPPPPRWTSWAIPALMIAAAASFLPLAVATQLPDAPLRDALGYTFMYGQAIVWSAFIVVCLVAIAVRVWRHFRGWPYEREPKQADAPMNPWLLHWGVATFLFMFAGAMWHVWWQPIAWWTNGHTLTPQAMILVASLGAAWTMLVFVWKRMI